MATEPTERPARPGEICTCGRPATLVYITAQFGEVPYCEAPHVAAHNSEWPPVLPGSIRPVEEYVVADRDAALRERTARRATWPDGEPASVRDAADDPLRAVGDALLARIWAFGQRRGEDAMLAALRVLLAVADGHLDEDQALPLMARIHDGEHAAVLEEIAAL